MKNTIRYYLTIQQFDGRKWIEKSVHETNSLGNFTSRNEKEVFRQKQKDIRVNGLPTRLKGKRVTTQHKIEPSIH